MSNGITHADLVKVAAKWLKNIRPGCGVILTEMVTGSACSTPDAIGWMIGGRHSVLVECKVSRSDFLRDKSKPHRRYANMGNRRYYLVLPGIIKDTSEMPEGWGWIEYQNGRCVVVQDATHQEADRGRELCMFYSLALRKWQHAKSNESLNEAV